MCEGLANDRSCQSGQLRGIFFSLRELVSVGFNMLEISCRADPESDFANFLKACFGGMLFGWDIGSIG